MVGTVGSAGECPAVSVVMPVFNSGRTLSVAIESICRQTFTDWELLVLDDGSDDESLEIARVAAASDDRVKPIPLDHTGLAGTLIRGLELATGEFVARMDADDISLPNRFEKQVAFLRQNPDVAVVGGAAELFSDQGDLGRVQVVVGVAESFHYTHVGGGTVPPSILQLNEGGTLGFLPGC